MPVMVGAVQETSILVVGVVELVATVGVANFGGGSFTSDTLTVMAMVSSMVVFAVPSAAFLSVALTVTLYEVLAS